MQASRRPTSPVASGNSPATVDGRSQRSRRIVLAAALELLTARGVGGFTVDEVARRSGVAKTTIYRHWPTREKLVLDACTRLGAGQETPNTGALLGDLRAYLMTIVELLMTANWAAVLPSIIDAAEHDADFADVHADIQRGHAAPVRQIVRRAIARGELPKNADPAVITAAALGPLFYRRWFSREPLDEGFIAAVAQRAITQA